MQIKILASGSTGNAYWLSDSKTEILIECGISIQKLRKRLNYRLSKIQGCLVSHEHEDHSKAIFDVSHASVDIYCSAGTSMAVNMTKYECIRVKADIPFKINSLVISPFAIKHDAVEPLGFIIQSLHTFEKVLFVTDTAEFETDVKGLTHIMIECNYDEDLLQEHLEIGTMPERLRNRVEGSHLSLAQCKKALSAMDLSQTKAIYLLHLSQQHSDAGRFIKEIQTLTGIPVYTKTEG